MASPLRAQDASTAAPNRIISLGEAYALSLKRSEAIAQDAELYRQALANVELLKSDALPRLSVNGSETFQENPHTGFSSLDKSNYTQAQLTLTQPIFSGFREFLAFKAGKRQAEAAKLTEQRAESLLYQDVAQAYLTLLEAQKEIGIRQGIIDATNKQVEQLGHWVEIGRSRESELLAAQSQLAGAQAQLEITRSAEAVDQELMAFLLGEEAQFVPQEIALGGLEPMDKLLAQAQNREDVQAAEKNLEYSQLGVKIMSRQRWGTVDFTGDYYLARLGFSENTHYDAIFSASLPLFDSGQVSAQVKGAQAQERSSSQALSLARRAAEHDVRSAYRNLQWAQSSVDALAKAENLAAANLDAQLRDYRRNLVTNLDVLTSLNTLQATRIQLAAAKQQAVFARAQLEVAAGGPAHPAGASQ